MKEKLKNITVEEYTSPCPDTVTSNTTVDEIIKIMDGHEFRHLPVVDDGKLVGIISQRDIISMLGRGFANQITAAEIMTDRPYTVYESTPIEEVAYSMSENKFGCALVLDSNQKLAGIFTTTDALNALIEVVRGDI